MIPLWSIWIVLLGLRDILAIFEINTFILTGLICLIQLVHLFIYFINHNFILNKWYFILIFLLFCTLYNFSTLAIVNIVLSIILLKHVPIKNFLKLASFLTLSKILIWVLSLKLGFIHDSVFIMPKGIGHTLGFSNPNLPGKSFLDTLLIITVFLLFRFNRRLPLFLFLIPNYLIYISTLGRTSYYCVLIYFLCILYFCRYSKYNFSRVMVIAIPFILYAATIVACRIYQQYPILDKIFTTRFSKNAAYLNSMSIVNYLIGLKLPEGPMDSAYLAQLFQGGITSVCIFLFISTKGILNMSQKDIRIFLPFIICLFVSGFAENTFSTFCLSTILFYKILIDQFEIKTLRKGYII